MALDILKQYGYKEPLTNKICFNSAHELHWYEVDIGEPCSDCESTPLIERNYMPISDKIQRWFFSPEMCDKMLDHWKDRDSWLHETEPTFPLKEIWNRYCFKDLQWLWDPD